MQSTEPRKQVWVATKIPNLFKLGDTYYGRVKLAGKSVRRSFGTTSFQVVRGKLRDWLVSLNAVKTAPGGTFGGIRLA